MSLPTKFTFELAIEVINMENAVAHSSAEEPMLSRVGGTE